MWSYFGSKSKIVHLYPRPKYDKIIEPFAGSARYALKYFEKDVLLVDKYQVIIDTWEYLKKCSPKDIIGLPILKKGMDIRTLNLSKEELNFVGFLAGVGQGKPSWKVSPFAAKHFDTAGLSKYKKISENIHKIKHWNFLCASFDDIENEKATWFIDPPYQRGGQHQYKFGNKQIDFEKLSIYCKERNGQVIVCENTKADWMLFKPIKNIQGANNTNTTEAIWSNEITDYDNEQMVLQINC